MDVFRYVNSKDIRNYLRQIKYNFSSIEAAWLIFQCKELSYLQKKDAWKELITVMPDMETPKRMNSVPQKSLHFLLKRYMEIVERELEEFVNVDNSGTYIYSYSYLYKRDKMWSEEYETPYSSYERCIKAYREEVEELDEIHFPEGTGVVKYRIRKQLLDNPDVVYEMEFAPDGELFQILRYFGRTEDEYDILDAFEGWWFDFPTPFEKGDIVWIPCEGVNSQLYGFRPFVLKGLSTWNPLEFVRNSGDNSDMNGYGFFVGGNGSVYQEVMQNYMDLEYYNGPFHKNEKILPALSQFVKGEIEIDLLLCAFRKVIFENAMADNCGMEWYPKEKLIEIGLIEPSSG